MLALAAFAAREAVVLKYGPKETAEDAKSYRAAQGLAASADYAGIVQGGLFGKGSLLPVKESAMEEAAAANVVLVGTAEGVGYAIFMDTDTGVQKAFKKGESVFGGGTVASVSTKKAELETGGRRVLFKVPSTMPVDAQRPGVSSKARIATSKGEGQWAVDQRAIEGIFDNMDRVLTDARFTPYIDDGKLSGFKVSELRSGGVFSLIGLHDGDVVLSINDYKLDSPGKVAQILGGLRGETQVQVDILRGKQPRTLNYQIK